MISAIEDPQIPQTSPTPGTATAAIKPMISSKSVDKVWVMLLTAGSSLDDSIFNVFALSVFTFFRVDS